MIHNNTEVVSSEYDKSKKRRRAVLWQCIFATVPLFGILLWLLIKVAIGESRELSEENADEADKEAKVHVFLDLQELLYVFITILYLSSALMVYVGVFVPQRKKLFKEFKENGIVVFGDVMSMKQTTAGCNNNKYFEAVYAVQGQLYKKSIRTVFPWHRERIPFLVLPNQPKSGLPKADIELDVSNHGNHYSKGLIYVGSFWVLFSLFGAVFTMLHFKDYYTVINDDDKNNESGNNYNGNDDVVVQLFEEDNVWQNFWILLGACAPLVFGVNYIRYLFYYRFLVKSGKKIDVHADAKTHNQNIHQPSVVEHGHELMSKNIGPVVGVGDLEDGDPTSTPYVAIT